MRSPFSVLVMVVTTLTAACRAADALVPPVGQVYEPVPLSEDFAYYSSRRAMKETLRILLESIARENHFQEGYLQPALLHHPVQHESVLRHLEEPGTRFARIWDQGENRFYASPVQATNGAVQGRALTIFQVSYSHNEWHITPLGYAGVTCSRRVPPGQRFWDHLWQSASLNWHDLVHGHGPLTIAPPWH